MKVLQFGKFYPPVKGGIETATFDITEGLMQSGVSCDVLCANRRNSYRVEIINGYRVFRIPSFGVYSSTSLAPLMVIKLFCIQNNYDIIHSQQPNPLAALSFFLTRPKAKIVLHWQSDIIKQRRMLKIYAPLQEWLLRRADAIIATTPTYINGSRWLSRHRGKITIIPNGINDFLKQADYPDAETVRKKYPGRKIVFGLGRLVYYKGFQYLVEAAKLLGEEYVVLIGGDGCLRPDLEKQIRSAGLGDKVFLLTGLSDRQVKAHYAACDVFCLSSCERSEAFGVVQVEAMSFGKPVVATKIKGSGVDWVNRHGESGLNVEPKNPQALAGAIKKICENPETYHDFCRKSRQRFEENFTRDVMVQSIKNLYENLLRG